MVGISNNRDVGCNLFASAIDDRRTAFRFVEV